MKTSSSWQFKETILSLKTGWLTLFGEKLETPQGETLDYWRIEKADSIIVLPVYQQQLLLPPPVYRPGVGQFTWDFPGGRHCDEQNLYEAATAILERELGVANSMVSSLSSINQTGWLINSSFSNQRLYGFVAELKPDSVLVPEKMGATYPLTPSDVQALLDKLLCLQCRSLLMEWWTTEGWQRFT